MSQETSQPAAHSDPNAHWRAFLPISLVAIITTLDASVVNVSLPVISKSFNAGIGVVEWVILAYLLAVTSLLMISGRIGDLRGRRRIYQAGIITFTLSSAVCGFATSIYMLIASRALQGIGAALIVGNGPALIGEIFPPQTRGKALGLFGTMVALGLATGPAVGGVVTSWLGWRYIFFLNLPLGLIAAILVRRNLRADTVFKASRFDIKGGAAMALGLLCFLLAFSRGTDWGWSSLPIIGLLIATVVLIWTFLRAEKQAADPILDLKLFANPTFRSSTVAGFLSFASLFAQTFLLPFYLINLRHFEPAHAGLFLMAVPSVLLFVSPAAGSLSDRIGTRRLCLLGTFIQGVGFFLLAQLRLDMAPTVIFSFLMVIGLGSAIFNAPNNSELLSSVPRERLGNASGMMGLTRTLGMVCGVALSSAIFSGVRNFLTAQDPSGLETNNGMAFIGGLRWAFYTAVALAWVGMLMVWGRGKDNRKEAEGAISHPKTSR